ncbi:hypothetical protein DUZ99_13070 [Xylanibacillus composti]|nr:hypothetical protein [Xylanibacillus composti]
MKTSLLRAGNDAFRPAELTPRRRLRELLLANKRSDDAAPWSAQLAQALGEQLHMIGICKFA